MSDPIKTATPGIVARIVCAVAEQPKGVEQQRDVRIGLGLALMAAGAGFCVGCAFGMLFAGSYSMWGGLAVITFVICFPAALLVAQLCGEVMLLRAKPSEAERELLDAGYQYASSLLAMWRDPDPASYREATARLLGAAADLRKEDLRMARREIYGDV